MSAVTSS